MFPYTKQAIYCKYFHHDNFYLSKLSVTYLALPFKLWKLLQSFNSIWIFYEPRELLAQVIICSDLWDPVYGFSESLGRNLHPSEVWFCISSKRWTKGHISLGFCSIMSPIQSWIWVRKADPLNTSYILFVSCLSPRDLISSLMTLSNDRERLSTICLSLWNPSRALRWAMICIIGIIASSSNHLLISTGERNPNLEKTVFMWRSRIVPELWFLRGSVVSSLLCSYCNLSDGDCVDTFSYTWRFPSNTLNMFNIYRERDFWHSRFLKIHGRF